MNQQVNAQAPDILSIYSAISSKFFGNMVPVDVCNLIFSYLVDNSEIPHLQLLPMKNTTNTLMLECSHILFNEFSLQETFFIQAIQRLIDQRKVPKQLICIKSKKFNISIDLDRVPVMQYVFQKQSTKNEMNSSIYFEMKSIVKKEKTYKILMFRKGKINIPGIQTIYQLSEIQVIVQILLKFYKDLTQVDEVPKIITDKLTMCNFVTKLNILEDQRLNLQQIAALVNKQPDIQSKIEKIAAAFGTRCMQFQFIQSKIVLYILFELKKQTMPFVNFNAKSTSQRKKYRSIAITVTQRGFVLVQGANDDFKTTNNVLRAFMQIVKEFMSQYIYVPLILKSNVDRKQKITNSLNTIQLTTNSVTKTKVSSLVPKVKSERNLFLVAISPKDEYQVKIQNPLITSTNETMSLKDTTVPQLDNICNQTLSISLQENTILMLKKRVESCPKVNSKDKRILFQQEKIVPQILKIY